MSESGDQNSGTENQTRTETGEKSGILDAIEKRASGKGDSREGSNVSGDQSQGGDGAEGGGKAEGEAEGGDKEAAGSGGAPDDYSQFSVPEGFTLEGESLAAATGIFRELGLSQEKAQKLVDWEVSRQEKFAEEAKAQQIQQSIEWDKQIKSDPILGGKNYEGTVNQLVRALSVFDIDGAASKVLVERGIANEPALVRMLAAIGSAIKEDNGGGRGDGDTGNPYRSFYPTMYKS